MFEASTHSPIFTSNQIEYSSAMSVPTAPTTIYYATFPPSSDHPSPNSVIPTVPPCDTTQCNGRNSRSSLDAFQLEHHRPAKMLKREEAAWTCPVSSKASQRSSSTINDRLQPIVERIQMGYQRVDGKNPISLAVSTILVFQKKLHCNPLLTIWFLYLSRRLQILPCHICLPVPKPWKQWCNRQRLDHIVLGTLIPVEHPKLDGPLPCTIRFPNVHLVPIM
jgi:hypothetical protein